MPQKNRLLVVAVAACISLCTAATAQELASYDLLIRGGTVIDGTGGAPVRADVAVRAGRIAAIGDLPEDASATRELDATGLVVAPGFIDVHAHAENATSRPEAPNFVLMGVTTIVSGNCGTSSVDLAKTFARLEKSGVSVNFASLVGHATVRTAVLGRERRAPDAAELDEMRALVRRGMEAGAVGLSTGLIYVPGTYAKTDELIALAAVVGEYGGIYASHMRNENDTVLEAIDEALRIGEGAGVPVHLSHLKASAKRNWGKSEQIIAVLQKARAAGRRVTADQYAYAASSTSIDVLFPSSELSIGRRAFAEKIVADAAFRGRMRDALYERMDHVGFGDLSYCRIANAPNNMDLNGRTIAQAAKLKFGDDDRESQARMALELFGASGGKRVSMIYHTMSEDDVDAIMRQPFVAVAADAGVRVLKSASKPHPRGSGNNPRVLGRYVRERGVLSLPLAVHKMTQLPARVFGLRDRGTLEAGAWADITLFDPNTVLDNATFDAPTTPPDGIPFVIVNGVIVVERGEHNRARPGMVLRHTHTTNGDQKDR